MMAVRSFGREEIQSLGSMAMEMDYTGGKGPGQAKGKGRMVVLFLDTPNNHILFCLQVIFQAFGRLRAIEEVT